MNKYNNEYYRMNASPNGPYPPFRQDNGATSAINTIRSKKNTTTTSTGIENLKAANDDLLLNLKVRAPEEGYKLADYHTTPEAVLSARLKQLVEPLKIHNTQFISTRLRLNETEQLFDQYFLWHIYNVIPCIDWDTSIIEELDINDYILEAISLSDEILDKIPLQQRLLFRPDESLCKYIVHESLVERLQSFGIEGAEFTRIADVLLCMLETETANQN